MVLESSRADVLLLPGGVNAGWAAYPGRKQSMNPSLTYSRSAEQRYEPSELTPA
jgi:hypothetical protein